MNKYITISLGAGVQSSCLALMASHGELQYNVDFAVFADTGDEPDEVYEWLSYLESNLKFPVFRVKKGNLGEESLIIHNSRTGGKYMKGNIPAYVMNEEGKRGILWRKCTGDYKIEPIHKFYKNHLKIKRGEKETIVLQMMGISTDEIQRMKPSKKQYIEHIFPLIDLGMSRRDCLDWMIKMGYPTPPRSACTFCPFHSDEEWLRLKKQQPIEFSKAVNFERKMHEAFLQQTSLRNKPYLHKSCIPLDEVIFKEKEETDHFDNECEGLCGV